MRILVLSNTPWAQDNSFGSSYSGIFAGMEDVQLANIYCQPGTPDNAVVDKYFQMSEQSLLRNLRDSSVPSGSAFTRDALEYSTSGNTVAMPGPWMRSEKEVRFLNFARMHRWQILFWARDWIWALGRWDSPELTKFITEFSPDIIFQPVYYSSYLSDIALRIAEIAGVPVVGYVSDDVYTMRQFSLSPLFWLDRVFKRRKVKKVIERCAYLYVISEIQRQEYSRIFNKDCRVLTKGGDFGGNRPEYESLVELARPLRFVYTGNIGGCRWRSLALIASVLRFMNARAEFGVLHVYTGTPLSRSIRHALSIPGSSVIHGAVSGSDARDLQRHADVLVHAEGLDLSSRLQVHQSFSTKIVDYFETGRCVLAVGPRDAASISYLRDCDAALVASNKDELEDVLALIAERPSLISEYGRKGWECGRRNHDRRIIQRNLQEELGALVVSGREAL